MAFAVGSLVKARGREWVVLPESAEDFLRYQGHGDVISLPDYLHRRGIYVALTVNTRSR
jgi:hypothetical protein